MIKYSGDGGDKARLFLFNKIDRIPSFDIRYSTFCGSSVRFFLSFLKSPWGIRHVLFLDPRPGFTLYETASINVSILIKFTAFAQV